MKRIILARILILALLVAGIFLGGIGIGYRFASEAKNQKKISMTADNDAMNGLQANDKNAGEVKKDDMALKLALLKDYTNFVYMPAEKLGDVPQYIAKMDEKVSALGNPAIEERYYSTGVGSPEEREQRVIDFFNFLIDGMIEDSNNSR